jgi:hypothetical protein
MKLPDKVKIGAIIYDIEFVDEVKDDIHCVEFVGRVLYRENKIKILNSYSVEKQFRALLHEIIHILDEDLKIGFEENDICRLEAGLYQVLKDNNLLKD